MGTFVTSNYNNVEDNQSPIKWPERPVQGETDPTTGQTVITGADGILFGNKLGASGFGQSFQTAASPAFDNRTFLFASTAERLFAGVNLKFFGNEATSFDLKFRVAASNEITDDAPTEEYGDVYTVTVPARIAAGVPSEIIVPNIPVMAVPRADGQPLPVLYLLAETATGPVTLTSGNCNFLQAKKGFNPTINQGRWIKTVNKVGQFVDNPAGFTATAESDLAISVQVEFIYAADNIVTVMGLGDSITHGSGTTSAQPKFLGAGALACYSLSTPAKPIFYDNQGVPSTTTAQFLVRLKNLLLKGSRPQVCIYSPFSPNDGTPSSTTVANQRTRLAEFLRICDQYNIIPILTTGCPNTAAAWNATADNFRKDFNDEIRNSGRIVVDYDAVLSDQATPARFIPELTTDGTHPNQAGYNLMANPLAAGIKQAIKLP